jgi:hypothetical protein
MELLYGKLPQSMCFPERRAVGLGDGFSDGLMSALRTITILRVVDGMTKYVGLDWAAKGWFGVILTDDGEWKDRPLPVDMEPLEVP